MNTTRGLASLSLYVAMLLWGVNQDLNPIVRGVVVCFTLTAMRETLRGNT